jgi:hypothetical protein
MLAGAVRVLNKLILSARKAKLTRSQHVMFLLADIITWCEVGAALCLKAAKARAGDGAGPEFLKACARIFARQAVEKAKLNGVRIAKGCGKNLADAAAEFDAINMDVLLKEYMRDMDFVAGELTARV